MVCVCVCVFVCVCVRERERECVCVERDMSEVRLLVHFLQKNVETDGFCV